MPRIYLYSCHGATVIFNMHLKSVKYLGEWNKIFGNYVLICVKSPKTKNDFVF